MPSPPDPNRCRLFNRLSFLYLFAFIQLNEHRKTSTSVTFLFWNSQNKIKCFLSLSISLKHFKMIYVLRKIINVCFLYTKVENVNLENNSLSKINMQHANEKFLLALFFKLYVFYLGYSTHMHIWWKIISLRISWKILSLFPQRNKKNCIFMLINRS